jgi:uncharacterized protein YjbJ (UPF0337 family)
MILLRQVRQALLSMGLVLFISTTIAFSFASEGWAATSFRQGFDQPGTQIAAMDQAKMITKNVEGTAQEAISKMVGDPKNQVTGKTKKLEAKTRKGINNSIENPNYQPGGKTKQAENLDQKARGNIQSEVREAFK